MSVVQLTGIRLVAFDMDDTLYPERSFALSGFAAVADWLRPRVSCSIDPAARMCELFEAGDRGHVFDRLLAELGRHDADSMVPEMVACYRAHTPMIELFPDADEALTRWAGAFRLAVISDGPLAMQRSKADALGLPERVDRIILTDQWDRACWKPHPRAFEELQADWNLPGPACLYVGDNPEKDFVAPRKLGWRTVRVRREGAIYASAEPSPGGQPELESSSLGHIDIIY